MYNLYHLLQEIVWPIHCTEHDQVQGVSIYTEVVSQ